MIDYYNLADNQYHNQVYTGPIGTNASLSTFYWVKPRGITMVHITAIGAGGGGASGNQSTGTAASGGSGGGSGAITRLTIPAILLSESLKVTVGAGGTGGTGGSGGANGASTYVDIARGDTTVIQTRVVFAAAGSGGNVGLAGGASAGGPGRRHA